MESRSSDLVEFLADFRQTIEIASARLLAITEEEPGPAATAPRAWRARLDVELPTLGIVHADFSLNGNALQIMLSAALPETVDQLRSAQEELVGALAAHALDVTGVGFRHDAA